MRSQKKLKDTHPEVFAELLSLRSAGPHLEELTPGSNRVGLWRCSRCHLTFETVVGNRTRRGDVPGCGACKPRAIALQSSIAFTHPSLVREWASANRWRPQELSAGTKRLVLWRCSTCTWLWRATPNARTGPNSTGCPACAGRELHVGVNDLATLAPELLLDWSSSNEQEPSMLLPHSSEKVTWLCHRCGNQEQMSVHRRAQRAVACLACYSRGSWRGKALTDTHGDKLVEWDFSRNELPPAAYHSHSSALTQWFCSKGHSYTLSVSDKILRGKSCKRCTPGSSGEKELQLLLEAWGMRFQAHERKLIKPYEVDLLLEDKSIGIEFNGLYWHSDAQRLAMQGLTAEQYHGRKLALARDKGVTLLFVWEDDWSERKEEVKKALLEVLAGEPPAEILQILGKG